MNKEELEKVEQLIEQKNSEELKGLLSGLHPADIAELCNELDGKAAEKVIAIQKTVTIIFWVLVAVAVCVLIYIWYRLDARYEERQKLAAHGGREKEKKKHNN